MQEKMKNQRKRSTYWFQRLELVSEAEGHQLSLKRNDSGTTDAEFGLRVEYHNWGTQNSLSK